MKKTILLLLVGVCLLACDPQDNPLVKPIVATGSITEITATSASCSGTLIATGGSAVTARGICWSAASNPTTSDFTVLVGTGVGNFIGNLTNLIPNTTYYVRAFATNSEGTGYGLQKSFRTNNLEGDTFTDSRDNNVYRIVTVGTQVWMAENLAYLPSVVGKETESDTKAYYYVYDYNGIKVTEAKDTDNYKNYGVLYNWSAAMAGQGSSNAVPSQVQGICPTGWHLPSSAEWKLLIDYLIANDYNYDGTKTGNKIGKAMASTVRWNFSSNAGAVGNIDYEAYRNKSGLSLLPGGYLISGNKFYSIGDSGSYWSSTKTSESDSWAYRLFYSQKDMYAAHNSKSMGNSVRCVRD